MSKKSPAVPPSTSFEEALSELQRLVAKMEAGELPLDESVAAYGRGAELVQFCTTRLDAVEEQVKMLEAGLLKPLAGTGDGA